MVERVGVCVWGGGGFVRRARGGTSYTQAQNEGIAVKTSTEETDNLLPCLTFRSVPIHVCHVVSDERE